MIKKSILAGAITIGLLAPGCLGPNNAHDSLRNWNATATSYNWLNEVIYWGLNIIPVYGLFYLGDQVVFNTIAYWGDDVIGAPGEFPESFKN
jgi:hypothetical protein